MIPLKDRIPSRHLPWVTYVLIAANFYIFWKQLNLDPESLGNAIHTYGLVPVRYTGWATSVSISLTPFLSSMFLHGGWMHIIGNMWALWLFGDNVEDRLGPIRYLFLYLASGIVAGVAQIAAFPHSSVPIIGASGAIAGVMAAYLFLYPMSRILTLLPIIIIPLFVEIPAVIYIGFWFVVQLLQGTYSLQGVDAGGVAWWAHIGGFGAGLVCLALFWRTCRRRRPETRYY